MKKLSSNHLLKKMLIFCLIICIFFSSKTLEGKEKYDIGLVNEPSSLVDEVLDWPMLCMNPQRTSFNPESKGPMSGHVLWKIPAYGATIVAEGRLYISGGHLTCADAYTGEIQWQWGSLESIPVRSPCFYDGKIVVLCDLGPLCCLNASTGELLWSNQLIINDDGWETSPVVIEGRIYVSQHKTTFCVDLYTGNILWKFTTNGYHYNVAYSEDCVYVNTFCLNAENGEVIWNVPIGKVWGAPSIFEDRHIMGTRDGLSCLNKTTGNIKWFDSEFFSLSFYSECAIAYDRIYTTGGRIGSGVGSSVICFDLYSGELLWEQGPISILGFPHFSVADNKVYFNSGFGFFCLDAINGEILWSYGLPDVADFTSSIYDGMVYISPRDGNTYCFGDPQEYPVLEDIETSVCGCSLVWKNYADQSLEDINWDVQVLGDYVFGKTHAEGTIEYMQIGENMSTPIGPFFGFGDFQLLVSLPGYYEWEFEGRMRLLLFPSF